MAGGLGLSLFAEIVFRIASGALSVHGRGKPYFPGREQREKSIDVYSRMSRKPDGESYGRGGNSIAELSAHKGPSNAGVSVQIGYSIPLLGGRQRTCRFGAGFPSRR